MKFLKSNYTEPTIANVGDKTEISRFALIPRKITSYNNDSYWIWLESYIEIYEYSYCYGSFDWKLIKRYQ